MCRIVSERRTAPRPGLLVVQRHKESHKRRREEEKSYEVRVLRWRPVVYHVDARDEEEAAGRRDGETTDSTTVCELLTIKEDFSIPRLENSRQSPSVESRIEPVPKCLL